MHHILKRQLKKIQKKIKALSHMHSLTNNLTPIHSNRLTPRIHPLLLALFLTGAAVNSATAAPTEVLNYGCKGWMPIYLGSWAPINPDTHDSDTLRIEVNQETRMTSFVLTMIGRTNFATKISEAHVKGAIAYKQLMVDDMIEFIDFALNRGTGEVTITALEKSRRAHTLYHGRCNLIKSEFPSF